MRNVSIEELREEFNSLEEFKLKKVGNSYLNKNIVYNDRRLGQLANLEKDIILTEEEKIEYESKERKKSPTKPRNFLLFVKIFLYMSILYNREELMLTIELIADLIGTKYSKSNIDNIIYMRYYGILSLVKKVPVGNRKKHDGIDKYRFYNVYRIDRERALEILRLNENNLEFRSVKEFEKILTSDYVLEVLTNMRHRHFVEMKDRIEEIKLNKQNGNVSEEELSYLSKMERDIAKEERKILNKEKEIKNYSKFNQTAISEVEYLNNWYGTRFGDRRLLLFLEEMKLRFTNPICNTPSIKSGKPEINILGYVEDHSIRNDFVYMDKLKYESQLRNDIGRYHNTKNRIQMLKEILQPEDGKKIVGFDINASIYRLSYSLGTGKILPHDIDVYEMVYNECKFKNKPEFSKELRKIFKSCLMPIYMREGSIKYRSMCREKDRPEKFDNIDSLTQFYFERFLTDSFNCSYEELFMEIARAMHKLFNMDKFLRARIFLHESGVFVRMMYRLLKYQGIKTINVYDCFYFEEGIFTEEEFLEFYDEVVLEYSKEYIEYNKREAEKEFNRRYELSVKTLANFNERFSGLSEEEALEKCTTNMRGRYRNATEFMANIEKERAKFAS